MAIDRFFQSLERYVQEMDTKEKSGQSRLQQSLDEEAGVLPEPSHIPDSSAQKLIERLRSSNRGLNAAFKRSGIPLPVVDLTPVTSIDELGITLRTYNCLARAKIRNAEEILDMTANELRSLRNFGEVSFDDLVNCLTDRGYLRPIEPQS